MYRASVKRTQLIMAMLLTAWSTAWSGNVVLQHQGRLLDSSDEPINGAVAITYRIFDVPTGGIELWSEVHASVAVSEGLFTSLLGQLTPLSVDVLGTAASGYQQRWLEVVVGGSAIVPRTPLVATPAAALSSRVLGDIATSPGVVSMASADSAVRMTLHTDGDSAGLVFAKSGVKRFGIGIDEPSAPSGTAITVGDLNADGHDDMVISVTGLHGKMALNGDGRDLIGMQTNVGINEQLPDAKLHVSSRSAASTATVMCDADSVVDELSSTSGGNLLRNMRTRINQLEALLKLTADTDNDGVPDLETKKYVDATNAAVEVSSGRPGESRNNANIGAVLNGNVVIGARMDSNGDGITDADVEQVVEPGGNASMEAVSRGSGGLQARSGSYVGGGPTLSRQVCDIDDDGDGISERSSWLKVDNSESAISTAIDQDDNGTPDVGIELSSKLSRNTLKSYFERGDKPTQSQFRVVSDSSGSGSTVEVDTDNDDDPDGGCEMTAIDHRSVLKTYFETGDIPTQEENRVVVTSDSAGAISQTQCEGTGRRSRLDQSATPSGAVFELSKENVTSYVPTAQYDPATRVRIESDNDSAKLSLGHFDYSSGAAVQDAVVELETSTGTLSGGAGASAQFRMGRPAINTALISVDDNAATLTLEHYPTSPGDRPTQAQFGNLIDSYVHLTDDGITRCAMTSTTGLQLRDQFGNVRTTMSTEGSGYFSEMIGIGKTPTEKIDVVGGAYCDGTNWVNASDENAKENFEKVDGAELLEKLSELEITKWNYKGDEDAEHIGPTAQDFKRAFGVGADEKTISTIDPSGIALAAIKELYAQLKRKDKELGELRQELTKLKNEVQRK